MDTVHLVVAISKMVKGWHSMAHQAITSGNGELYIPGMMSKEDFLQCVTDPSMLVPASGENDKEPAYLSLADGYRGKNKDGTRHRGFIVIDVVNYQVTNVIYPDGSLVFSLD